MKPTIYLSGPMSSSGREDMNFPRFNEVADQLRKLGFPVLNPADFGADPRLSWRDCLARDIAAMANCHILVSLEGWHNSRGAVAERQVAEALEMLVFSIEEVLESPHLVPKLEDIPQP